MEILRYNPDDYSEEALEDRETFRGYHRIKKSLRDFEIKCNLTLFKLLFEDEKEGERLWNHFTVDCGRNLEKFITYLTDKQYEILLYNSYKNDNMYYP